jgi:hypothetical protein
MNKVLEVIESVSQASTESLIVLTVLFSLGFSYMVIKLVLTVISGNTKK